MAFAGIFKGRRVFVTGQTGFKGSWLTLWLAELGAKVYGYALKPPTSPSLFEDAGIANGLAAHQIGDIRDAERLREAMHQAQPEIVFHLAAQPLVRASYENPRETYETNVMGTVNLLEAVRSTGSVRVCQVITSDKCYENREWQFAYRENDRLGGRDPYSNSKACAELVASSYRSSFFHPEKMEQHGVSLASCRAGNVIGGGDWAEDRIIPDCVRALRKGMPIAVRNPQAVRPWQHVLEPLSGYLWLAAQQWQEPQRFADAWNFGPAAVGHVTVEQVVQAAIRHWGSGEYTTMDSEDAPHEARFLKLDATKADHLLDWRPALAVEEAIGMTMDWYKFREEGRGQTAIAGLCLEQIRDYAQAARKKGIRWAQG